MATAKKLPSGAWRVQAYLGRDKNGKKMVASFTAPTKKEAELQAAQFVAEHKKKDDSKMTVAEAIERYITAKTPVLSPSTIRMYRNQQRLRYDSISDKLVFRLTTEDMQLYISELVTQGLSPKTVANCYGLLASSVALFRPDRVFRVSLPKRAKKRRTSPSDSVVMDLYEQADETLKKCIVLAAFGSLRCGEICALKHQDITGNLVHVHADIVKDEHGEWVYKDFPKTSESIRTVALPDEVIDLIGNGVDDEYVIGLMPSRVSDRFYKLRERMGLDVRLHDLRHYYASIGAVLQIPDTYLSSFGGWRSTSPVMKETYQNVITTEADRYSSLMVDHFSKVFRVDSRVDN